MYMYVYIGLTEWTRTKNMTVINDELTVINDEFVCHGIDLIMILIRMRLCKVLPDISLKWQPSFLAHLSLQTYIYGEVVVYQCSCVVSIQKCLGSSIHHLNFL